MRIFFAVPRSAWVDLNLRRSLEDMGHELVRFDFPGWPDDADPAWQRAGKPATNQRLIDSFRGALERGPIDLFYGYFYSSVVYPETIDLIRASAVPTVNFSCNNVHQFDLVRDIAPRFDVCVVPERSALADFQAVGARPLRIQLAANPRVYRPLPEPRMYDVTFVGQRYADRADFLGHLHRHGVAVRAWGAGWQIHKRLDIAHAKAALALIEDERFDGLRRLVMHGFSGGARTTKGHSRPEIDTSSFGGPRLLQRDLIRMFSQSRLSLGFATAGDSHLAERRLTHLRLREFEAPMSGALYLTEDQPELAEYFEPGAEVLTYTDQHDLLDKVRHYLAHPEQAERMRRAGLRRARRDHTWQQRFAELFAALGLRPGR
ncbi:MAG: glycosyltransferase [Chloroflexi bacterium]|nr:glycosyltransferase [Chloroflexota bacterium]